MGYTLHKADGTPWGGEGYLSRNMKDKADELGGYITNDDTGDTVYPEEA